MYNNTHRLRLVLTMDRPLYSFASLISLFLYLIVMTCLNNLVLSYFLPCFFEVILRLHILAIFLFLFFIYVSFTVLYCIYCICGFQGKH